MIIEDFGYFFTINIRMEVEKNIDIVPEKGSIKCILVDGKL